MNLKKCIGGSICLLALSSIAFAEDKPKYYAGLDAHYLINTIGNEQSGEAEFDISGAGLRAGLYLEPQVGLEVYAAQGVTEGDDIGIDMSLVSSVGILGRFESPEAENGGKLFILLGYGMSELEMTRSASSPVDRELYHGVVYGGGAEFRLGSSETFINIQGLRYYDEDHLSLDGVSLGLRQSF
ncbi:MULTISPECIES: outer membrane beta-barrel protein [unclassified Oleiphilus]|jgi:hypothetical protein|uniref:outer membrane beta-barrel protein n=2 Tax=Oleiphilus TaxID=141450 RepID=UPI0007C20026|nr:MULTISPECIES: outer membrane beta-barrel protein [unclassified Oleiphilus]KZY48408.1 hypothetical protein A3732_05885 [Oleiphilus sp. HI0050]KZY79706.1 hypothetical protein A3740_06915 [Oleiphilus sp. HI0068]KZY83339.1 hypothetical protein A3741_00320 [Oleiphilus sp. HI0069]KZY93779.1 hypothetical protein A3743_06085 [Oleiphilus sp. HI0072]KZZ10988.1 hypothetical protein A3749_09930 [Oleiphilus sp. HI0078]KZZ22051.1 hypothetical protein A3752_07415 [Oleiphilus sp. HI0081]